VGGTVATDVVDLLELLKKSVTKSGGAANEQGTTPAHARRPGVKKARSSSTTKRRKKVA